MVSSFPLLFLNASRHQCPVAAEGRYAAERELRSPCVTKKISLETVTRPKWRNFGRDKCQIIYSAVRRPSAETYWLKAKTRKVYESLARSKSNASQL